MFLKGKPGLLDLPHTFLDSNSFSFPGHTAIAHVHVVYTDSASGAVSKTFHNLTPSAFLILPH